MMKRALCTAALLVLTVPAFAETTVYRDVQVFSNTGTPSQWTYGEIRPMYEGYYDERRPVYGGAVNIGRQSGRTSANVGFYFGNDDYRYQRRPGYGYRPGYGNNYHHGYRDGYRDGARRGAYGYRPYVQDTNTIVLDGGEDRYECKLTLYSTTYVARAHFRDIAQARVYENCTNNRNSANDCRNAQTRCESIW